jgi:glycosyltransferase involved in cell wall biosynthesis
MIFGKTKNLRSIRVGYVPMSKNLNSPGDKRRFVYYANLRNINFEIADPSKKYDLIVITQNSDLSLWKDYEKGTTKIIYDFIDSYLAIPKSNVKGLLRGVAKYFSGQSKYLLFNHWKAIGDMCSRADAVICSTQEQRNDISKFCSNVHIILDAHMGVVRSCKSSYSSQSPFRIIWEGLPQNISSLESIATLINNLNKIKPIELHIVTDTSFNRYLGKYGKTNTLKVAQKLFKNVIFHEWDEKTFANCVCSCDLAIIPINLSDPFAAGKPENKLLLFWRMGMPVVTSATPAYLRAMSLAGMDYTARYDSDWIKILSDLINNPIARQKAGALGKSYVEKNFSEKILIEQWDSVLKSCGITDF